MSLNIKIKVKPEYLDDFLNLMDEDEKSYMEYLRNIMYDGKSAKILADGLSMLKRYKISIQNIEQINEEDVILCNRALEWINKKEQKIKEKLCEMVSETMCSIFK